MRAARLNDAGIERFGTFLDSLISEAPMPLPKELLTGTEWTEQITPAFEVEHRLFGSKFEAAKYLFGVIDAAGISNPERDKGLWAWLALFYFESLCPPDSTGRHKPKERARWIPDVGNWQKYYRHYLAAPYQIYRAHRDDPRRVMGLLFHPPHIISDVYEQIAARQQLITNKAVVGLATRMYYDPEMKKLRKGGGGSGAGSPRRIPKVLGQFDLTYDLYAMTEEELAKLLPKEFGKFLDRPKAGKARLAPPRESRVE